MDVAAREDTDGSPAAGGRMAVSALGSLDASEWTFSCDDPVDRTSFLILLAILSR